MNRILSTGLLLLALMGTLSLSGCLTTRTTSNPFLPDAHGGVDAGPIDGPPITWNDFFDHADAALDASPPDGRSRDGGLP